MLGWNLLLVVHSSFDSIVVIIGLMQLNIVSPRHQFVTWVLNAHIKLSSGTSNATPHQGVSRSQKLLQWFGLFVLSK